MPDFEIYERTGSRRRSTHATVTITRRGVITFSGAAWEALGSPAAVTFLYYREERLAGFRSTAAAHQNAHRVRGKQHVASAVAFLRFIKLDASQTRRWPLIQVDGTYCIDLKEAGTPVTSNRRKG